MSGANLRLQVVLQALDKASAPFRKVLSGSKALAGSLQLQQDALRRLNAAQRDVSAYRQQQKAIQDTAAAHRMAQQRVRELAREMDASVAPTRKLSQSFAQAKSAARQLKTQHQEHAQALHRLRGSLDQAGISTRRLGTDERRLRAEISKTSAQMDAQRKRLAALDAAKERGRKMQSGGMSASAHGAGFAVGASGALRRMMAPIKDAMAFESAMADVRKVVDFESPEAFGQMSKDIKGLSLRLPMVPTEIAKIVAAAGQANVPREELLRFTEEAAMMGVAFDMSAEDAGKSMATWRTAFRLNQDEVVSLADKINHLGNTGSADVGQITAVLERVGALGEVAGLDSGGVAALGATIAAMGTQSEVAATGIKNVLLTLSSGDAATARQAAALRSLGLDASDMAKAMQQDAGGALVGVLEKLKELPQHAQSAALTQLFGRESIGAVAPLLTNLDQLKENFGKVADASKYADSMKKEFLERTGTSENAVQLLNNAYRVTSATLGELLLPEVKKLSAWAQRVLERFVKWVEANPKLVLAVSKLAIAGAALLAMLGGVAVGGGLVAMMLSHLHKAVMVVSGGLGKVSGVVSSLGGRGLTMLLNVGRTLLPILGGVSAPILAIGIAVGVVAALVWKYWEPIKAFMAGVWGGVVEAVRPAMEQLKGVLSPLAPLWDMVSGAMGKAWAWVKQLFAPFEASSEQLQGATEAGRGFGEVIGKVLGGGINLAVGAIGLLTTAFKTILPIIMTAIGGVWTYLQGAWDLIVGLFTLDGARITEGVTKIWDGLNQILGGWPAKLMQTGIDMINGLINGALSLEAVVQEKIMGIASSIMGTFKSALGIASPSKVFAQFGEFTMQGLAGGLESSQGAPLQQITGVGDRMKQAGAGVALGIAAMPAMAAGGPVLAPGASAAGIGAAAASYTINIQAPAGVDAEGIARLVRQEIEAIERQKASRLASRLTD
jgi:TP901 family phage tail tape measure protein